MNLPSAYRTFDGVLATAGEFLQPVLLLVLRGWWGWEFFVAGKGKFLHLDKATAFFAKLDIPFPQLNTILAGSVECIGGLLLILGLGSRVVCVPLIFTMGVAYATAHKEELGAIFSEPDKFTGAAPFLFLLTAVIVFAFGPGKLSLDALLSKKAAK